MKKLSFSIPTAKPQSNLKPKSVDGFDDPCTTQNDGTQHSSITEFTIPPIQNQWKHNGHSAAAARRRTPEETELLCTERLQEDLQRLPEAQGLEEFKDVPVKGFGAAVLGGYGWTKGMGIGKNAKQKEDVKVVQFKGRTSREGLGFVLPINNNANFDLSNLQL